MRLKPSDRTYTAEELIAVGIDERYVVRSLRLLFNISESWQGAQVMRDMGTNEIVITGISRGWHQFHYPWVQLANMTMAQTIEFLETEAAIWNVTESNQSESTLNTFSAIERW